MKKIILKLFFLFFIGFIFVFIFFKIEAYLFNKNVSFKINPDTDYVVFGHSHAETALNDSLITNFENFSRSGDAYFYIYPKVKKIIKENKNLKVVLIEFSNNQVTKIMNEWTWGDRFISTKFKEYEPFIDMQDQYVLLNHNFPKYYDLFFDIRKINFWKMINKNYSMSNYNQFGGYNYLVRDKTDSLINNLTNTKIDFGKSKINIDYLEKTINFLKKQNIKVILIRTPIHSRSLENKNELVFKEIIKESFSSVEFLDFNAFNLENKQFGDLEHLNYRGAKVFSLWFDSLIKKGLFDKKNKQDFIDLSIASYNDNKNEIIFELDSLKMKENYEYYTLDSINKSLTSNIIIKYIYIEKYNTSYRVTINIDNSKNYKEDFKDYNLSFNIYPQNKYKTRKKTDIKLSDKNSNIVIDFDSDIKNIKTIEIFVYNTEGYKGVIGNKLLVNELISFNK
jgi:hypothetical protein